MAKDYNIQMKQFNGTDFDNIYPKTKAEGIIDIRNNYYTKNETLTNEILKSYGLSDSAIPADIFNLLKNSVIYKGGIENIYLKNISVGSSFIYKEEKFIKITDNYNGDSNSTLVLLDKELNQSKWNDSLAGKYIGGALDTYLNNTVYNSLSSEIKSSLVQTNIKCYSGSSTSTSIETAPRYVFAPSMGETFYETGLIDGESIPSLKSILQNHNIMAWFRTPGTDNSSRAYRMAFMVLDGTIYYDDDYPKDYNMGTVALMVIKSDTLLETKNTNISYEKPGGESIPVSIIEIGSYMGTGKFGSSNPCSLTFNEVPKFVSILHSSDGVVPQYDAGYNPGLYSMASDWLTTNYTELSGFYALRNNSGKHGYGKKSSDGKTFYWYDTGSAENQLNTSGIKYYYYIVY